MKICGTLLTALSTYGRYTAEKNVNQACIWWTYQEKIPETVFKKLKK